MCTTALKEGLYINFDDWRPAYNSVCSLGLQHQLRTLLRTLLRTALPLSTTKSGCGSLQTRSGLFCGVVTAHAVDSASWRGGGGADVKITDWRGVVAAGGAEEKLAEIYGASGDVPADQVGVHFFESAGGKDATG